MDLSKTSAAKRSAREQIAVNADNDTLGGRLSRAREAAGLAPAEFANALGVRKQTLAAWETDRSEPRANRLIRMAIMLNVNPAWLIQGIGPDPSEDEAPASIARIRKQMRRLVDLQGQMKLAIAGMAENLARAEKELR